MTEQEEAALVLLNSAARDLEEKKYAVLVNCVTGYWGRGSSLAAAVEKAYTAGARGTPVACIDVFIGPEEALEEVIVLNPLLIEYPQSCARIRLGAAKLKMQKASK